jgi:pantoate--beta-alanine ligase
MQLFNNLTEWLEFRKTIPSHKSVGFVPTMGNLHQGHASLFSTSAKENDLTVASVFVNPTQFNQPDDFTHYPRTPDADMELMKSTGVDFCIFPDKESVYPDGYTYQIQENELCQRMEGAHRPGHFNGVLTVVMKLLQLTRPTNAYFGEKDYQQFLLIRGMAAAFFMPVNIKACPTIRENSGLAFSSRNNRLSPEQRLLADEFARIFHQPISCEEIIKELMAKDIVVDYVEDYLGRRFAAVFIGDIRLIDNYEL